MSLANNKIIQMHAVSALTNLSLLNLPNNEIISIDGTSLSKCEYFIGLNCLTNLRWLNLSCNRIKYIENLEHNVNLKHLDLSENQIRSLGNLSKLVRLKTLLLHFNNISSLESAPDYFPESIEILSLAGNTIKDFSEIFRLVNLKCLSQFSLRKNPCTNMMYLLNSPV
ncbi:unnamed protein product [Protopolystoma xenopodis]|uniref:Protein phosphatase 1 regulatory subunit 7 n=1 Tax=Protopolystoma xenopodis TaxID=117903 RepID=A0A448XM89_9PLAT|nr:unnamed protein product [Protopolystoma xenopodis]